MSKIILDAELRAKLHDLTEHIYLCDETGETVGHFLPASEYRSLVYALAEATCPYSEEELQRAAQEKGGRPLAEIWKSLGVEVE
jgi:hypothetical protein